MNRHTHTHTHWNQHEKEFLQIRSEKHEPVMWKRAALLDFDGVQEPQMNEKKTPIEKNYYAHTSIGPMNKSDEQIFDGI